MAAWFMVSTNVRPFFRQAPRFFSEKGAIFCGSMIFSPIPPDLSLRATPARRSCRDPQPSRPNLPMENQPSSPVPYLLFFRNSGPETHQHLSPEQRQQLVTRWNAWYDGLAAEGKAVEGQPLELETRIVSGTGGARVTDGPFAEAKEAIGGYVKLLVNSLEEATAIAQRHPGLPYGLVIEIRQMTSHCHLGVNVRSAAPAA